MKKFTIIYQFNHSRMGFQNEITVDALDYIRAEIEAKRKICICYGEKMLKRFTFKLKK